MTDLATLAIVIDSRPATDASVALDRLAQSARGAGLAADTFNVGAGKGTAAAQAAASATAQAAAGLDRHTKALNDNAKQAGLTYLQFEVLRSSVTQFADQVIAGANPLRAFVQQATGASAAIGDGGLGGLARNAAASMGNFASGARAAATGAGVVGVGVGTVAAALATAVVAQQSYASSQRETELALLGIGRASGATVGQINALSQANASAGGISTRTAREMAAQYASTGRIGGEILGDLQRSTRDYAATTGQSLGDAQAELAKAFAEPAKGAELLNTRLGFLDAATRETIQTLDAQGHRLEAQRALYDAISGSIVKADTLTSGWGRTTAAVGTFIASAWDRLGQIIDRGATGGDLETRIRDLQRVLATPPTFLERFSSTRPALQAELDKALADQQRQQAQARQTDLAQRSLVVDNLGKQYNPQEERLKQITDAAQRIRTELAAGVLDPDGKSLRTAEGLEASARRIREDLAQGGTQFANALRESQFALRTVGFSPQAQRVAGINERAENEIRDLPTNPNDPLLRDYQIHSIRQRQQLDLEAARRQTYVDTASGSGRYAIGVGQAPEQYRDLIYSSAAANGVNPDLIASQIRRESRFNPNAVSPAGAQGISQFMPATAAGMGLANPFDPAQAIPKQSELMAQLLRRFDGNEVAALVGYNAGPKVAQRFVASGQDVATLPEETRTYVKEILTPPPNAQQAISASVERNRALANENNLVALNAQYLGVNGEKLDAAARYQQALNQAIAQGVEITPQYRAELMRNAEGMAAAARGLAGTRAGADLAFDRDQLGRDRYDQRAYAGARSIYGDTATPAAQAYIDRSRDNQYLAEARSTLTDAMTGFASDLLHGRDAAQAFGSVLSRVGDKLLGGLMDSLVGSLFKGSGGLGALFGFADGGFTGYGGRNQPAGIVHAGEVVWSQADVARFGGPHVVNAMRLGLPGYADGGPVGFAMPNLATLPNMPMPANANAAGDGPQPVAIAIDARGAQGNSEIQAAIQRGVSAGMAQVHQTISRNINGIVATGQRRYARVG